MAEVNSGVRPGVGDLVWLCPGVGVYGQPPIWVRVLGVRDAMIGSHAYLRGYPVDEPGTPRVWYVRLAGLRIRPDFRECDG